MLLADYISTHNYGTNTDNSADYTQKTCRCITIAYILPVDVSQIVQVLQALYHVSQNDGYHWLFEARAEGLRRMHDVRTRTCNREITHRVREWPLAQDSPISAPASNHTELLWGGRKVH